MVQHNLLLTYRNFKRHNGSFFINLIGLSSGLAGALLIYLWVSDELNMDRFHKNDNQLYQVMQNVPLGDGGIHTSEHTPGLLAKVLADEMPEVEYATSVIPPAWFGNKGVLSFKDTHIKAGGQFIGKDYFNIFSWKFIDGDKNHFLTNKHAVAISDELARKLFHTTENVIGKTIEWEQDPFTGPYIVAGIFEKPPRNSTAQFDVLFSYDLFFDKYQDNLQHWGNSNPDTYVVIKEGVDVEQFSQKITQYLKTKFVAQHGTQDLKSIGPLFLQRFTDKYLNNHYENGKPSGGRIAYVKLFSIVALFILVIACINFMNLSTASASTRLKEIGVKKAIGADRKAILLQFLGESILMTFLALVLAVVLVLLLLPEFNNITGKHLTLQLNGRVVASVLAITIVTGLLSGSYPALYLSGFEPITVLKGKLQTAAGEVWARKGLVVFQFTISVILIVSVIMVYRQIEYIQSKNLGYNKDNIIIFANEGQLSKALEPFLTEVKKMPGVTSASSFGHNLVGGHGSTSGLRWQEQQPGTNNIEFGALEVGYDLLEMLTIQMAQGRTFSKQYVSDSSAIILNEAAIAFMGIKAPVGKTVSLWGKEYHIIGVAKNFHFESLYERVKPCFMRVFPTNGNVLVKIAAGQEKQTLARIQQFFQAYNLGLPFEYRFLDQDYQALYAAENRIAILSRYFAGIAILISFLGLFGLAMFSAEQRTKEIGIRKVLGASVSNLVALLTTDFLKPVIIAILIAVPVAWYAMHEWLQGFAYKVDLAWWVFAVAAIVAIVIAALSVSFQAIKAALMNPVRSLRSE
jgi:ABC-type antimicrobial peptide transport system permease subunit